MLINEVLKIRDFNKLSRLLFTTPQQLLRDPLWGRGLPVGNHCFRLYILFTLCGETHKDKQDIKKQAKIIGNG